jgi:hypothetical protein
MLLYISFQYTFLPNSVDQNLNKCNEFWEIVVKNSETVANREVAVSHQSHREPPGDSDGMWCGVATAFGGGWIYHIKTFVFLRITPMQTHACAGVLQESKRGSFR